MEKHKIREFEVIKDFDYGNDNVTIRYKTGDIVSNHWHAPKVRTLFTTGKPLEGAIHITFIACHPEYFREVVYDADVWDTRKVKTVPPETFSFTLKGDAIHKIAGYKDSDQVAQLKEVFPEIPEEILEEMVPPSHWEIELTNKALKGMVRQAKLQMLWAIDCEACDGRGFWYDDPNKGRDAKKIKCPKCNGTGKLK